MTKQTYEEWRATRHLRPNFEQDEEESSDIQEKRIKLKNDLMEATWIKKVFL